jgi:hypothetical protein
MTELHPEADALFQVIATGHPLPDQSADAVRGRLEHTLKLPAATADRLLAGKPVLLKRALTRPLADDYCVRLRAAGLAVEIVPMPAVPAVATTTPIAPTTAAPGKPAAAADVPDFVTGPPIDGLVPVALRLRLWPQTLQLLATPLLYGLLLLLVLGALLAFAIYVGAWLRTPPLFFSLPVYLLPLLAGLTLFAVLLRPLLPLRPTGTAAIDASTREPHLQALVAQLCQRLGAAAPAAIHVDLSSGARVALNRGRDGWQRGHYTLRVGLPLLQNAALPVLAGALAAELVFAREPALLRLHEIVTRVRSWLQRQNSTTPDRLSVRLARLPESRLAAALQRADRWVTRQLATAFDKLAQRSSHHAERTLLQMGDRASVAIAGAGTVAARLSIHYQLEHAIERARQKNTERRIDRRLVDDLAPLVAFFYTQTDSVHEKKIARAIEAGSAALAAGFSDRDRIGLADTIAAKTTSDVTAPTVRSHRLLADADALGRDCTAAWYAAADVAAGERMPAERLVDDALLDLEQCEAGAIYFNSWLVAARGWRLPDVELLRDMPHADARLQLNVCVNEVRRLTPDRARLLAEFARLQTQLNELLLGQQVLAANHSFQFRYLKYDGTSLTPLIEKCQREIAKVIDQLGTQESIMGGRIALGLKLFGQDGAATESLHRTLHFLGEQEKALYRLEQDTTLLENLLQHQRQTKASGYADALARLTEKVGDASVRLLDKLTHAPSPPDRRYAPLRDFFDDHVLAANNVAQPRQRAAATAARARSVLDGFYVLNEKLSLLAAEQASSVEEAYKIERIRLVNAE